MRHVSGQETTSADTSTSHSTPTATPSAPPPTAATTPTGAAKPSPARSARTANKLTGRPLAVAPATGAITGNIVQVEAGNYHTCLRTRGLSVYCWGQGAYGQLGTGTHFRGTPTRTELEADAAEIQAGGRFGCARRENGELYCWGEDDHGQLGRPHTEECGDAEIDSVCGPIPRRVPGLTNIVGLALGEKHACAIVRGGRVTCWGSNEHGQIGGTDPRDRMTPTTVARVEAAEQLTAGDHHSCALIGSPGRVRCWGDNGDGQAGGSGDRVTTPVAVAGLTDVVEVVGGGAHTCARHADGSVSCWGYNYFGQLGAGSTDPTETGEPLTVQGLRDAVQLAAGRYSTCARRAGGSVVCWGLNRKGEIGDGTTTDHSRPTVVSEIDDARFLTAGKWHYCAIRRGGAVACWGDNLGGQLGTGGHNEVANPRPVPVAKLPTR